MKTMSMGTVALLSILAVRPVLAASPERELAKQYDALLGGSAAPVQQKLTCPEAWKETTAASGDGKRKYIVFRCASTEGQVYVTDGKVFALGVRLHSGLKAMRASALSKEMKQGLVSEGCKLTDRGQAAVARCDGGKAMALLNNWDSKTDTNNISMLYGLAEVLLPIMGIPLN